MQNDFLAGRIRKARVDAGLTQAAFARGVGVTQPTVSDWERGHASPSRHRMAVISELTGKTVEWLMLGAGPESQRRIKLIGTVQAGAWKEAWECDQGFITDVPHDMRFPGVRRFALEVAGDSMNQVFEDGDHVICVKFLDIERGPRSGEYVVLHRQDKRGLFEATIKQYMAGEDGTAWLWPRSDSPSFQQPIMVDAEDEDAAPVIHALVIGSYQMH